MADLLFLTQRIPYPPIKGEKIRPLQILRHLRRSWTVHLGCLVDNQADEAHIPTVQALCDRSYFARLDPRRARVSCLTGLLSGEPLSVTFYRHRGLQRWTDTLLQEVRPEAIFICSSNMAPYALDRRRPRAPGERVCLVDLADVDSEKWRSYAENGRGPMAWVHRREWRKVAALEGRIARECDWSTFVTAEEAALFAGQHPREAARIRAVCSGVDHVYFDPALPAPAPWGAQEGPHFTFTGTMDYPPNVEAVCWFARDLLPAIRASLPDARFHIVGASPAPAVQALAALPGVEVTGRVPDVRPYLAHAIAVAPMKLARGIQNKVLEAMAMGRPTVATQEAAEGIEAEPGRELTVAEGAEDFVAACLALACDPARAAALGAAARARVMRDHVWEERLRGFDALLGREPARVAA